MKRELEGKGLKAYAKNTPNVRARWCARRSLTMSIFCRDLSLSHRCRTIRYESLASESRPRVAAVAPISAISIGPASGRVKPIAERTIHVGGANAGMRLRTKIIAN